MSQFTAAAQYGCAPMMPTAGPAAVTQQMGSAGDRLSGWSALVHPDNPLLWFGGLLAVTFGLAGVAGRVRLGPASAGVKVGKD